MPWKKPTQDSMTPSIDGMEEHEVREFLKSLTDVEMSIFKQRIELERLHRLQGLDDGEWHQIRRKTDLEMEDFVSRISDSELAHLWKLVEMELGWRM